MRIRPMPSYNMRMPPTDTATAVAKKDIVFTVKMIAADDTYKIRHRVLWPNRPISEIKIPEDINARHFGAYIDGKLVGVVSLFREGDTFQFRKLAVLAEYRGHGIGKTLINSCIIEARKYQVKSLWCDARSSAIEFYKKLGFSVETDVFMKNGKEYQKAYFDISRLQSKL